MGSFHLTQQQLFALAFFVGFFIVQPLVITGLTLWVRGKTPGNVLRGTFGSSWCGIGLCLSALAYSAIGLLNLPRGENLLWWVGIVATFGISGCFMLWYGDMRRAVINDQDIRINYVLRRPVTIAWADVACLRLKGSTIRIEMRAPGKPCKLSTSWKNVYALITTAERLGVECAGFEPGA